MSSDVGAGQEDQLDRVSKGSRLTLPLTLKETGMHVDF